MEIDKKMHDHHEFWNRRITLGFILLVIILLFVAFKFYKISHSGELQNDHHITIIDAPSGELVAKTSGTSMIVKRATGVRLVEAQVARAIGEGESLEDGAAIVFGNNIYELSIARQKEKWRTVFWKRIDEIRAPVTVGARKKDQVLLDWNEISTDVAKENEKVYARFIVKDGGRITVAEGIKGLKVIRGSKSFDIKGGFDVLNGDILEGHSFKFRIKTVYSNYTDPTIVNSLKSGRFLSIETYEATPKTQFCIKGLYLQLKGFYYRAEDLPLKVVSENELQAKNTIALEGIKDSMGEFSFVKEGKDIFIISSVSKPFIIQWEAGSQSILSMGQKTLLSDNCDIIVENTVVRIQKDTDGGFSVFPITNRIKEQHEIPLSKSIIISSKEHLLRILSGEYIPDSYEYAMFMNILKKGMKDTCIENRGFFKHNEAMLKSSGISSEELKKSFENLAQTYNRVRAPVGVLVTGSVRYLDKEGNIREITLDCKSGWKSSKSSNNPETLREVMVPWQWHPPLHLYTDIRFSGLSWMWQRENYRPESDKPGEKIERLFILNLDVPGEVQDAKVNCIGNGEIHVSVNSKYIFSKKWGDFEEKAIPVIKGKNTIAILSESTIPASCEDEVYLPFSKDICGEIDNTLKKLSLFKRLPSKLNKKTSTNHVEGSHVIDADKESIPRLVVLKGNYLIPSETEIMLDNVGPKQKSKGDVSVKRIIIVKNPQKEGSIEVFNDNTIRAEYVKGKTVCVEGKISNHFKPASDGYPPRPCPKGQKVCFDADREGITWGNGDDWLQYSTYPSKLLTGDVIIADMTTAKLHQVEVKNNNNTSMKKINSGLYLDISVFKSDTGKWIINAKGNGIVVHGGKQEKEGGDHIIVPGDIIEIPSEGIKLKLEDARGVLAVKKRVGSKSEWAFQKNTGLLPTLGIPGGSKGIINEWKGKDVQLTIDDDVQKMVQLELERGIHIARTMDRAAGRDKGKFYEGAFLLLDAVNGSIIAEGTSPVAEYNKDQISDAVAHDWIHGDRSRIVNRGWKMAKWNPGSSFKPMTDLAASTTDNMEAISMLKGNPPKEYKQGSMSNLKGKSLPGGNVRIPVDLRNYHEKPDPGEFRVDYELMRSINTYHGYIAALLYLPLRVGIHSYGDDQGIASRNLMKQLHPLLAMCEELGYNSILSLVPEGAFKDKRFAARFNISYNSGFFAAKSDFPHRTDIGTIIRSGIGQETTVTPLQQAISMMVIANRGMTMAPYIIQSVDGITLKQDRTFSINAPHWGFDLIQEGMGKVVRDRSGTGYSAFVDSPGSARNYINGKTGTAERGSMKEKNDSWFVGYVRPKHLDPSSNDPSKHTLVFVCLLADTGTGGVHAGDTVERVMRRLSRYYNWEE